MVELRLREMAKRSTLLAAATAAAVVYIVMELALDGDDHQRFWALAIEVFVLKILLIFALTKGGEALRSDLKDGTIEYLWTRPVGKAKLYLGFWLGSLLGLLPVLLGSLLSISWIGVSMGAIDGFAELALLWIGAFLVAVGAGSLSLAFSALTSKFVVFGIFYFALVEMVLSRLPTGVRSMALRSHASDLLEPLKFGDPVSLELFGSALLGFLAIGVAAVLIGALRFSRARYSIGGEKEG